MKFRMFLSIAPRLIIEVGYPLLTYSGIILLLGVIWIFIRYSINVPYHDDYQTSLEFLIRFDNAYSFAEQANLLFRQHSTHFTLFSNLSNLLDWMLFGKINFKHLVFIGIACLILAGIIIISGLKGENRGIQSVAVGLLFINCLYYGATLWPLAALQNFPVLVMVFGALLLLSDGSYFRYCIAAILGLAASFSSGNGLLFFFAGTAVLYFRRADSRILLAWIIISTIAIITFFGFHDSSGLVEGMNQGVINLVSYYITFLGSLAQVFPMMGKTAAPLLGTLLVIVISILALKRYHYKNPFIAGCILFILQTAFVTTLARSGNPYGNPLVSRYAIYSSTLIALVCIALIDMYQERFTKLSSVVLCSAAILVNILVLQKSMPYIHARQENLQTSAREYVFHSDPTVLVSRQPEFARRMLEEAQYRGIYEIREIFSSDCSLEIEGNEILLGLSGIVEQRDDTAIDKLLSTN